MFNVYSPTGAYMGQFSFVDAWAFQAAGYRAEAVR